MPWAAMHVVFFGSNLTEAVAGTREFSCTRPGPYLFVVLFLYR